VTSIRSMRKALETLDHVGLSTKRQLVLNRSDSKVGLDPADTEAALGMKIACSIPSSRDVPLSLNLGTPVVVSQPKSAVARQLQELLKLYAPLATIENRKGRRR